MLVTALWSAAAALLATIIYSRLDQQKLMVFVSVADASAAKYEFDLSQHLELALRIVDTVQEGEIKGQFRGKEQVTSNWDYVFITKPFPNRELTLQFADAFRTLDFISDAHIVSYRSPQLMNLLRMLSLEMRRYWFRLIGGGEDLLEARADKDEDEILVEENRICLQDDAEEIKRQIHHRFNVQFFESNSDASSLLSSLYPLSSSARLVDLGHPDSDSWSSVLVSSFADKTDLCQLRQASGYRVEARTVTFLAEKVCSIGKVKFC